MTERVFQRFAACAAVVVGVSTLLYGLVFLFLLTPEDKSGARDRLAAYVAAPLGRELAHSLLALGGLAAVVAVVALYVRLRAESPGWATWSLVLGSSFTILTALFGVHSLFLLRTARRLVETGDPALEAGIIAVMAAPSPLDPFAFTRYLLAGVWLLVTGGLMLRSPVFPNLLAYLGLAGGIGALLFFTGQLFGLATLRFATGLTGSAVVGPVFWIALGYVLWRRAEGMTDETVGSPRTI
jgi:hypothetical protein